MTGCVSLSKHPPALSELSREEALQWAADRGLPAFRGKQVYDALSHGAAHDIDELTTLPLALRRQIATEYRLRTLSPALHQRSPADGSEKVLFSLDDGHTIETVLIPSRTPGGRSR